MQDSEFDLRMKIAKYEEVLTEIANAGEQANPQHLSNTASRVLMFYAEEEAEPTTADEFNSRYPTNADEFNEQQEMIDRHRDMQAEIVEYDKKLSEVAESEWRDTVLHADYKSEYDEEE